MFTCPVSSITEQPLPVRDVVDSNFGHIMPNPLIMCLALELGLSGEYEYYDLVVSRAWDEIESTEFLSYPDNDVICLDDSGKGSL